MDQALAEAFIAQVGGRTDGPNTKGRCCHRLRPPRQYGDAARIPGGFIALELTNRFRFEHTGIGGELLIA